MAEVKFKRIESSSNINSIPIIDGQIIYTKDGKTYMDYETTRVVVNGTPETTMSDTSTNAVANSTVKSYVDTNINNVMNNIHNGVVLYNNTSGATGNITFDGDYEDYDYLVVTDELGTGILVPSVRNSIIISCTSYSDLLYQEYDNIKFTYSSTTLKTTVSHQYQGNYYNGANHSVNRKIYKIVGYNIKEIIMKERIAKLIDLKSFITIALTIALVWGFVVGKVETKDFLVYVAIVFTFYFTKKEKNND